MKVMPRQEFISEIKFKRTLHTNQYFIHYLFSLIKRGYSPMVIICGKQRIGKSFIAVWLSYLMMKLLDKEYDPIKHTFYDPIKSTESLERQDKIPLMIDEAGSILARREWQRKTHAVIDTAVQTAGYKSILWLFVTPFTSDVDKLFLKHFDFQVRVDNRGFYKAFRIVKKYDAFKPEDSMKRKFLDQISIPIKSLPKDIWIRYRKYSKEEKDKMRKEKVKEIKNKDIKLPIGRPKKKRLPLIEQLEEDYGYNG